MPLCPRRELIRTDSLERVLPAPRDATLEISKCLRKKIGSGNQKVGQIGGSYRANSAADGEAGMMRIGKRLLDNLDQAIREHIELETQEDIDRGMAPEKARYAALRKFGNVTRLRKTELG